jgi:hypothetical protein
VESYRLHVEGPMLNFNPAWRFESPGPMPQAATDAIAALIIRLAQGRLLGM